MSTHNGNGNHSEIDASLQRGATREIVKLLQHHESIVHSLRTTLALLTGQQQAATQKRAAQVQAKALTLDKGRRTSKKQDRVSLKEQRQRSIEFLAQFNMTTPVPNPNSNYHGLGPLVRRGYLKKKGDGYLRTSKAYEL